jgi:TolB-like protein
MGEFFNELKRRNVFRVAAAYLVSAWLIIQVVETTFPPFGFGDAAIRAVVITLSAGLIPVLIIAWVFELTPEGLKMDSDVDPALSITRPAGRKLDRAIVAILVLAVGYFAVDKFMLDPNRDAEQLKLAREAVRNEAIIAEIGDRSIAVLPFADMSQERDQSYFSEGIAEELLNLLAAIPEVRVTSRSSAFSFKDKGLSIPEIADRLRVSYVTERWRISSRYRMRLRAMSSSRSGAHWILRHLNSGRLIPWRTHCSWRREINAEWVPLTVMTSPSRYSSEYSRLIQIIRRPGTRWRLPTRVRPTPVCGLRLRVFGSPAKPHSQRSRPTRPMHPLLARLRFWPSTTTWTLPPPPSICNARWSWHRRTRH